MAGNDCYSVFSEGFETRLPIFLGKTTQKFGRKKYLLLILC